MIGQGQQPSAVTVDEYSEGVVVALGCAGNQDAVAHGREVDPRLAGKLRPGRRGRLRAPEGRRFPRTPHLLVAFYVMRLGSARQSAARCSLMARPGQTPLTSLRVAGHTQV